MTPAIDIGFATSSKGAADLHVYLAAPGENGSVELAGDAGPLLEKAIKAGAFTAKTLEELGCRCADSQTNFLFADIKRPAKEFRDACAKQGVMVGRDFPPFEKTHARISIGTMEEMRKAADVFRDVLKPITSVAR